MHRQHGVGTAEPWGRIPRALKRILDVVISGSALIALAPVFVVIGTAIRLDSRGPVLYVQRRAGHRRRPFRLYEFRTMVRDANARRRKWGDTRLNKMSNDPRVTRVGRVCDATRSTNYRNSSMSSKATCHSWDRAHSC